MLVLASESLSSVWVDDGVVKTDSQIPTGRGWENY